MNDLTREQIEYILQFQHPAKMLSRLPGIDDELVARMFQLDLGVFREIRQTYADRARTAADELLACPEVAREVDGLPFEDGQTVVGLADSITDDAQSWCEVLRCLIEIRLGGQGIRVVNAGISGDTTTHLICRFLDVVAAEPDWIICMVGTNDVRRHGLRPTKCLVSLEETRLNLDMLRNYAATQTQARWVWMTPTPVIEEQITSHWFLGPLQLAWANADLDAVAEYVRGQADPVVDLQAAFGDAPDPCLLLSDGLHPALAGQKVIVRALLRTLAEL